MELIWVALAFILGMAANAFGLPPLLGYLAGGFLLAALGASDGAVLSALAHYGVILLLFAIGLHIRLRNMMRVEVLGSSLIQLVLSAVVLGGALAAAGFTRALGTGGVMMVAILLGVASTVVAAKGLEERRELASYHGRVAIGILVIEDFILVAVLAVVGLGAPSPWALALVLLPLLRPALLRLLALVQHGELYLLFGLLLALSGAALFRAVGLSEELGAFVAGVLLSGTRQTDEIAERMWSLRETFLVAFFLQIGLAGLPDLSGWILAVALLLYLPVRVGIFFGLLTRFGLRARTSFFASASLASYSEFAIITGAAAARAGLIPESLVVSIALAVALSFAFGTPFNRQAPALYRGLRPWLLRWERDVRHPDAQPDTLGSARYLVVGMGRTGAAAYDFLARRELRVVGLDSDPARLESHRDAHRRVAYGVAGDAELWEDLDLGRLEGVILTIPDMEARLRATRDLRALGFSGVISATRDSAGEQQQLEHAGATSVCHPLTEAGERLAEQTIELRTSRAARPVGVGGTEPAVPEPFELGSRDAAPEASGPEASMISLTPEQRRSPRCTHVASLDPVTPSADGCEDCLRTGDWWVHLRVCMSCGHVGCCDSSPNRHATAHFHETSHPVVRSFEPGESWAWCYTERTEV